jgi:hypothetical protein
MLDALLKEFNVTTPAELFEYMDKNPFDPKVVELHELLELALKNKGLNDE